VTPAPIAPCEAATAMPVSGDEVRSKPPVEPAAHDCRTDEVIAVPAVCPLQLITASMVPQLEPPVGRLLTLTEVAVVEFEL